jgi:hypothetical protein
MNSKPSGEGTPTDTTNKSNSSVNTVRANFNILDQSASGLEIVANPDLQESCVDPTPSASPNLTPSGAPTPSPTGHSPPVLIAHVAPPPAYESIARFSTASPHPPQASATVRETMLRNHITNQ